MDEKRTKVVHWARRCVVSACIHAMTKQGAPADADELRSMILGFLEEMEMDRDPDVWLMFCAETELLVATVTTHSRMQKSPFAVSLGVTIPSFPMPREAAEAYQTLGERMTKMTAAWDEKFEGATDAAKETGYLEDARAFLVKMGFTEFDPLPETWEVPDYIPEDL